MGMVDQIARPGMQDAHQADLATHETRIASQDLSGLSRSPEESVIEELLIPFCKDAQFRGDGEGQEKVWHAQQEFLLKLEPFLSSFLLAFGAVAIAAGMITVLNFTTSRASIELSTQGFRAAALNIPQSTAMRRQ